MVQCHPKVSNLTMREVIMYTRCAKGYFKDNTSAKLGMARCWGHSYHTTGCGWGRCRYLRKCLHMSLAQWYRLYKDLYGGSKKINYGME